MAENTVTKHGAGSMASQTHSPCNSFSSTNQVTTRIPSAGLTNSSCSERPMSESSGGALAPMQISGNVADFQNFLDDPSNWEWAVNTFPLEPGRSDRNIFVSKLPPTFKDVDLHAMFENFGRVVSAKVMLNVKTGVSKETGFVQFEGHRDALRARAFLRLRPTSSPTTPTMPEVVTQWAQNKHDGGLYGERCQQVRKLFIRNLPASITQAEMKLFVSRFGDVSDISLHSDTYDPSSGFSAGRGRRLKQAPSEGSEGQQVEASSFPSGDHETIICFVTFADPGAAMRACRAIHNTTPFDSCNWVPLMAKLAEDNSSRSARRHHNAAAANADAASWVPCASLREGTSTYSGTEPTSLAGAGGHDHDSHQSQVSAPQRCSRALNHPPRPTLPPVLSAKCLNANVSPKPDSLSSTPPYSAWSSVHLGYDIPAPRRTLQQPSVAVSPTAPLPPASNATPCSPSVLSSTMSPLAPQQSRAAPTFTAAARQSKQMHVRRVLQPQAFSMDAREISAPCVTIPGTTMSAPTSPYHAAGSFGQTLSRHVADASFHRAHLCRSPPPVSAIRGHPNTFSTPVHTTHVQAKPCGPHSLSMDHDGASCCAHHLSSDLHVGYNCGGPTGAYDPHIDPIPSAASSEAFQEYASRSASGECNAYQAGDAQYSVVPAGKVRLEHQRLTAVSAAALAAPLRASYPLPGVAYSVEQASMDTEGWPAVDAGTQAAGWTDDSQHRAIPAAMWRCAQYPQTMVVNSACQYTTLSRGSSGPVRYRNNPYSMRLIHTRAQY
ncbi:hypothetical protein JKF63_00527 [Porcisia hertigi]|uniref:RRM domain-containing protein n=1 Tax=Porcisia hertigi TaxID=2761500 RepID=A0A836GYG5_9TRYP|nr:hypothetical protein JKF63_00527 [Porcisia hertigi]